MSRTMSRAWYDVQRLYSVENSSFHRVESPRYEHSGSKRHCAHKIERDLCKTMMIAFASFDVGHLKKIS